MSLKSSRGRLQRPASYSSLEERRLLAGNVTVVEDGHLYIRGDQADNQFEVVVEDGQLRINGLDGTTINRKDSFVVSGATVTESGVSFEGGLRAHLGPGHDNFSVNDAVFESSSIIYGGSGDDTIDVVDSQFLDRTLIQTFDGSDNVSVSGSRFEGDFYAITLEGQDTVSSIDSAFEALSIVATGNHSDTIHSEGSHYMGEVNLLLGQNGGDKVQLTNPVVGQHQLGVFTGNHSDTIGLDLRDATVAGTIRVSGQAGTDHSSGMTMGDEIAEATTVVSVEKDAFVFQSQLGGIENVVKGLNTARVPIESGTFEDDGINSHIFQFATPVVLETTETIKQFDWSGTYARDNLSLGLPDLPDNFVIEVYEDAGDGAPDLDSLVRFEVGGANRTAVGELDSQLYGKVPLYGFSAEAEYTMQAGTRYWVSIYTELAEGDGPNGWQWSAGFSLDKTDETLVNEGYNDAEINWRVAGPGSDPAIAQSTQMDLRLRA